MRILSIVGARPQFVKLAPIDSEIRSRNLEHIVVHTGQHYDEKMSDNFFEMLGISEPSYNLRVGSKSHGHQTGEMLGKIEDVLKAEMPTWVLVYGDTNSTLAGALAAAKLNLRIAHLEAGLRSFNRRMPEEINRIVTDHASDLLLAPTNNAMDHLMNEGLGGKSVLVGDVMVDICLSLAAKAGKASISDNDKYVLATIHRAENTDSATRLEQIISLLDSVDLPVLLTAHPRLKAKASDFGIELDRGNISVIDPLSYPEMIEAVMNSSGVMTDSGGLQKEAFLLRKLCVTLRMETEWVETVELGVNLLGADPSPEAVSGFFSKFKDDSWPKAAPYGEGHASKKVIDALLSYQAGE